jgi:hypothetical protein
MAEQELKSRADQSHQLPHQDAAKLESAEPVRTQMRPDHGKILSQLRSPASLVRASDVLALQSIVGNRAVSKILSARADQLGPRDRNGVADGAEAVVDRARSSPGKPLADGIRHRFEEFLGTDLTDVRVHTGDESAEAAQAVGAKAYAVGPDIHFAAGQYSPTDPAGMRLLAHEVAHTVQDPGGKARQNKLEVSNPDDAAEIEADRVADAMVARAASDAPIPLRPLGTQPLPNPSRTTVENVIRHERALSGFGQPLQGDQRVRMEKALGQDLSDVQVHANTGADSLTSALGARAATIGPDIYFASDQYKPGTNDYERLLSHELVHVAQTSGQEGTGPLVAEPTSELEHEARRGEMNLPVGKMLSVRPRTAIPTAQLAPRPLPQDAVVMTFPTPLDPGPVNDFGRRAAQAKAGNVWDGAGAGGQVSRIFQSGFFSQRNTAWASDNLPWKTGFFDPDFTCRVEIRLLEDNVREIGTGSGATGGSSSGVTATTGTSTTTQTGVSGTVSGTASGGSQSGPETSRTSGSTGVTAGGTASSQTTIGTTGGISQGGAATGSQTSGTAIYESTVFAEVKVFVKAFDSFTVYNEWSSQATLQVGTARYTRMTLAPVAAPAAPTP